MQFAIVANPAAGPTSVAEKSRMLEAPARTLDAQVFGLDALNVQELVSCARECARRCEVVVVAGGDGTFSDVMNALDGTDATLAYLPMGSGNALRKALGMVGGLQRCARRIAACRSRPVDLIRCDENRLAFMASIGLDATVLRLRRAAQKHRGSRFSDYVRATLRAYFKEHRRCDLAYAVDDAPRVAERLLNVAVVKQPYYGFGMKMVPAAHLDDGLLHLLCLDSGALGTALSALTALTIGNRMGSYYRGRRVELVFETPQEFQTDGDWRGYASRFRFEIAPQALKIRY